jgi:hypothetical protein
VFFDLQTKFKLDSPVFIGAFIAMRRRFRNLTNLSLRRLQITKDKKDSKRGRIQFGDELGTGSVTGMVVDRVRLGWFDSGKTR